MKLREFHPTKEHYEKVMLEYANASDAVSNYKDKGNMPLEVMSRKFCAERGLYFMARSLGKLREAERVCQQDNSD